MIGNGVIKAMEDLVKAMIRRVGRRCDIKVGINIIISFCFQTLYS